MNHFQHMVSAYDVHVTEGVLLSAGSLAFSDFSYENKGVGVALATRFSIAIDNPDAFYRSLHYATGASNSVLAFFKPERLLRIASDVSFIATSNVYWHRLLYSWTLSYFFFRATAFNHSVMERHFATSYRFFPTHFAYVARPYPRGYLRYERSEGFHLPLSCDDKAFAEVNKHVSNP